MRIREKKLEKKTQIYSKSKVVKTLIHEKKFNYSSFRLKGNYESDIFLSYNGKKESDNLLSEINNAKLTEISSFGQIGINDDCNFIIRGENLITLKLLLNNPKIAGKIKLIYIDPPFSTQQEFRIGKERTATISSRNGDPVAYSDNLSGAEYLEFLRERIILLRELLTEDGSMYLHIDYKIGHYVKILMDEIFGSSNFINDITRIKCNPKNFSRRGFGNVKDMILFYAKSKSFVWNEPRTEMNEEDIIRLFPKIDKEGRRYTTNPLHAPGETENGDTGKKWNGLFPPPGRHWRVPPKELSRLESLGLIEWSKTGNPRKKIFADDIFKRGKKLQDVWELKDPPYPTYPTEKNRDLLKRIINASSNVGDYVLDCFAGSGTTLIAAEELKRKWIGIDNSKSSIDIMIKRLRKIKNVTQFICYKCEETKSIVY
jgi:adenine-specific DNA-methyltransferase